MFIKCFLVFYFTTSVKPVVVKPLEGVVSVITPDLQSRRRTGPFTFQEPGLISERSYKKLYITDPRTGLKVVYPAEDSDAIRYEFRKITPRLNDRNSAHNLQKEGKAGTQTPKRKVLNEPKSQAQNRNIQIAQNPVYQQTVVREQHDDGRTLKKIGRPGKYVTGSSIVKQVNIPVVTSQEVVLRDPNTGRTQKEYSSRSMVRYPDGYAQENERRVESSSKYKTGSTSINNNRNSVVRDAPVLLETTKNIAVQPVKISEKVDKNQPLQGAGSRLGRTFVSDDIDDVYVEGVGSVPITPEFGINGGVPGYAGGFDNGNHFDKEKAKQYSSGQQSENGQNADKGYNSQAGYDKGKSEKHGHEENQGSVAQKEGEKKAHLDKSSEYASGHQASENLKGSDYHGSKGHRKGHKKKGFRTVHHKDEYKKDEEFFDEEHSIGENKQHGHTAQEDNQESGGKGQKGHLDSGYQEGKRNQHGELENGQSFNKAKGFKGEKGNEGFYGQDAQYGKKSGHKEGEVHGHNDIGGGVFGY